MKAHYFLAIPIPDVIKQRLSDWVENRKGQFKFKSWVYPQDYHITLHFLGEISDEQLERIQLLLPEVLMTEVPFHLKMTHFGSFGESSTPRVFWVGHKEEPSLFTLYDKVGEVCSNAGLEIERRPYRAHVTVARRWEGAASFILPSFDSLESTFQVDRVVLYRTNLKQVPKYEIIAQFPFSV